MIFICQIIIVSIIIISIIIIIIITFIIIILFHHIKGRYLDQHSSCYLFLFIYLRIICLLKPGNEL